jgi:hypothetical protein
MVDEPEIVVLRSVEQLKEYRQRGGVIVISDPVNDESRPQRGPAIHDPYATHVQPKNLQQTLNNSSGTYWWAPSRAVAQREIPNAHPCRHPECYG